MDPTATNPGDRKEKIAQATYRFTVMKTTDLQDRATTVELRRCSSMKTNQNRQLLPQHILQGIPSETERKENDVCIKIQAAKARPANIGRN